MGTIKLEKVAIVIDSMYDEKSLTKSLEKHGVDPANFFLTLRHNPSLDDLYARAQQDISELVADEVVEIADTEDDAAKARNRIDARKWFAAKMKPNKFGDRIDLNINQTVDITAALSAAKSRTRNVSEIENVQPIDAARQLVIEHTGHKPVINELDDIFDLDPSIKASPKK